MAALLIRLILVICCRALTALAAEINDISFSGLDYTPLTSLRYPHQGWSASLDFSINSSLSVYSGDYFTLDFPMVYRIKFDDDRTTTNVTLQDGTEAFECFAAQQAAYKYQNTILKCIAIEDLSSYSSLSGSISFGLSFSNGGSIYQYELENAGQFHSGTMDLSLTDQLSAPIEFDSANFTEGLYTIGRTTTYNGLETYYLGMSCPDGFLLGGTQTINYDRENKGYELNCSSTQIYLSDKFNDWSLPLSNDNANANVDCSENTLHITMGQANVDQKLWVNALQLVSEGVNTIQHEVHLQYSCSNTAEKTTYQSKFSTVIEYTIYQASDSGILSGVSTKFSPSSSSVTIPTITSTSTTKWTGSYTSTYSTSSTELSGSTGVPTEEIIYYVETPDTQLLNSTSSVTPGSFTKISTQYLTTNTTTIFSTTTTAWTGSYKSTYSTVTTSVGGSSTSGLVTEEIVYYVETPSGTQNTPSMGTNASTWSKSSTPSISSMKSMTFSQSSEVTSTIDMSSSSLFVTTCNCTDLVSFPAGSSTIASYPTSESFVTTLESSEQVTSSLLSSTISLPNATSPSSFTPAVSSKTPESSNFSTNVASETLSTKSVTGTSTNRTVTNITTTWTALHSESVTSGPVDASTLPSASSSVISLASAETGSASSAGTTNVSTITESGASSVESTALASSSTNTSTTTDDYMSVSRFESVSVGASSNLSLESIFASTGNNTSLSAAQTFSTNVATSSMIANYSSSSALSTFASNLDTATTTKDVSQATDFDSYLGQTSTGIPTASLYSSIAQATSFPSALSSSDASSPAFATTTISSEVNSFSSFLTIENLTTSTSFSDKSSFVSVLSTGAFTATHRGTTLKESTSINSLNHSFTTSGTLPSANVFSIPTDTQTLDVNGSSSSSQARFSLGVSLDQGPMESASLPSTPYTSTVTTLAVVTVTSSTTTAVIATVTQNVSECAANAIQSSLKPYSTDFSSSSLSLVLYSAQGVLLRASNVSTLLGMLLLFFHA
ncbi:SAG1 (YJR004C) [Zygosaccharomyces parabailii]|nr:SAG1 (YJR004C) [Zygosaccharomyces parabailii]CDH12681.1 uncharacterized protein ZBAI_04467 [Zygosaccharomyces bailii ISA1307]